MHSLPDVIVLCGGAGLRLRAVTGDAPKVMAKIAGRPFLELLLRQIHRHNFSHVIMAVGYQKETIRSHFGPEAFGLRVNYAEETAPLGTGGALRNAAELMDSDIALVMNGDSYTDIDLRQFVAEHRVAKADVSVVAVPADGRVDCGFVLADQIGNLSAFKEKSGGAGAPYVNAGIYLLSKSLLLQIPLGTQLSLERELLPRWLDTGRTLHAFLAEGACVDIGTPERFGEAQQALANVERNVTES